MNIIVIQQNDIQFLKVKAFRSQMFLEKVCWDLVSCLNECETAILSHSGKIIFKVAPTKTHQDIYDLIKIDDLEESRANSAL